ncbi:hypothetical protein NDU88_000948, partial [Pleurodeles waltl]
RLPLHAASPKTGRGPAPPSLPPQGGSRLPVLRTGASPGGITSPVRPVAFTRPQRSVLPEAPAHRGGRAAGLLWSQRADPALPLVPDQNRGTQPHPGSAPGS